jgi:ribosomal protein L29
MTSRPSGLPSPPMIALLLAFTADCPELSHEEIERQIAELERELATERPDPRRAGDSNQAR